MITLAYVDQGGASDSKLQGAWATPAALDTVAVTLDTGDTGVRSIPATGHTISSAEQGVIEVYAATARTPAL